MTNPHQPEQPPPVPYSPDPYQQSWPQPAYIQPVIVTQPMPSSGMATASLVFGIFGILGGWCLLGIPCIIAVVCGHAGLSQTKNGTMGGRGQAVAGLIMGYLVVGPAIFAFFSLFVLGGIGAVSPSVTPTP
jgi:hypothetical protein